MCECIRYDLCTEKNDQLGNFMDKLGDHEKLAKIGRSPNSAMKVDRFVKFQRI